MLPLPMGNALFVSLLQSKVPPDGQGRIFALNNQLGFAGATARFLLVGPLVDRVLVPAAGQPGWSARERRAGSACCSSAPASCSCC
jgi:MFS transporter, DHA3 family, macrolide efflux protein